MLEAHTSLGADVIKKEFKVSFIREKGGDFGGHVKDMFAKFVRKLKNIFSRGRYNSAISSATQTP